MAENIKILGVKLIKEGEKMELSLKESGTVRSSDSKTCEDPVHPDLVDAVKALGPHLAVLCDFIEPKHIKDYDAEKFKVTGYSVGGKDGEEGFTITGMRKTRSGKFFSINTPFERFEQEAGYALMGDLQEKITKIEAEVEEYLFNGKMKQPSLFTEDKEDKTKTTINVLPPESQEEKDEETLKTLRKTKGGNGSPLYADPAAMAMVADMDGADKAGDGEVNDMVKAEREKLRGRGKGKGKGNLQSV